MALGKPPLGERTCQSCKNIKCKNIRLPACCHRASTVQPGAKSNPDGFNSIPEKIICSGPAYYSQLLDWGMPADMLVIGGSFRYPPFNQNYYDSGGPILFATSSDTQITQELMAAVEKAASKGYQFLIKIHPLYPKKIMQSKNITITQIGLRDQKE